MNEPDNRHTRQWALIALVALAYLATGRLGLSLADVQENATLVWPPTGLSIAALVLFGPSMAIGVFIGALGVNLSVGSPPWVAGAIAVGNTLEAILAWALLRWTGFEPRLDRMGAVGRLLSVACVAPVASASVGVSALAASQALDGVAFHVVWLRWYLGDIAGAVVIAPLIFVAWRGTPPWSQLFRSPESQAVFLGLAASATVAFFGPTGHFAAPILPLLPMVFVVWAGLRLGPRGAVSAGVLASAIAIVATASGHGPIAATVDPATRILAAWAYVTTVGAITLVLAAAVAERERAAEQAMSLERERADLQRQMQHLQRLESLGILAGGVAHDVNNLLTVVLGQADLLEHAPPERQGALLTQIRTATEQMSALCDQLLTYAGETEPCTRAVRLAPLAEEMSRLVHCSIGSDVIIEQAVDHDLPPVAGDPALIRQILLNLLLNASQAIGDSPGRIRLEAAVCTLDEANQPLLSDASPGPHVVLAVIDDGPGIEENDLGRIFDPFFTTKEDGRGLGLAALLGAVRSQGGAIDVHSVLGEGTRFAVWLPLADPSQHPSQTVRASRRERAPLPLKAASDA